MEGFFNLFDLDLVDHFIKLRFVEDLDPLHAVLADVILEIKLGLL